MAADVLRPNVCAFLKIDVQGFEKQVIWWRSTVHDRCVGVQLELSFQPLYEGVIREALDLVDSLELRSQDCSPVSPTPATVEC